MRTNPRKTNKRNLLGAALGLALILVAGRQTALAQWTTNGNNISNTNSGNVGIGTGAAVPGSKLEILSAGTARVLAGDGCSNLGVYGGIGLGISSFSGCSNYAVLGDGIHSFFNAPSGNLHFRVANLNKMIITASGNVGIGTMAPGFPLSLGTGLGNKIALWDANSNGQGYGFGIQDALLQIFALSINDRVGIGYGPSSSNFHETLTVKADRVGIGTTAPSTNLHVVGDAKVTGNLTVDGNIAAKYQDVAEWVLSSEQIPAGTVVALDPGKSNQVISSTQAYDTRVAGVISERPGIALGESGKSKVLVATTGRVRVKVDASRGPIQIGDLLVTSDEPGVAMKSEPVIIGGVHIHRPGTLLGKALEPLDKGRGEILVLLSLQ